MELNFNLELQKLKLSVLKIKLNGIKFQSGTSKAKIKVRLGFISSSVIF